MIMMMTTTTRDDDDDDDNEGLTHRYEVKAVRSKPVYLYYQIRAI